MDIYYFYPVFKTLLASLMNDCKLVPIKDRQNTAMSTDPLAKLVWAISPAVTCSLTATKSNEWTLISGNAWASLASPQPKSATTDELFLDFFNLKKNVWNIMPLKNIIHT